MDRDELKIGTKVKALPKYTQFKDKIGTIYTKYLVPKMVGVKYDDDTHSIYHFPPNDLIIVNPIQSKTSVLPAK